MAGGLSPFFSTKGGYISLTPLPELWYYYTMNRRDQKQIKFRVPEDLHRRAKVIAAQTGQPIQQVLEELLREWVAEQEQRLPPNK